MRQVLARIVALVVGIGAGVATASDIPFGGDGIPYLSQASTLTIRVAQAERIAAGEKARAVFFSVQVGEVLKGEVKPGTTLNVAVVLEAGAAPDGATLKESIVFLTGPLPRERAQGLGLARDGETYLVVSGRYGIVPAGDETRQAAIREYIGADKEGRLGWARKYLANKDAFLQRSALLEAAERPADDPAVLDLLGEALRSEVVTPRNKDVAIRSLQYSDSPAALQPLREFVHDGDAPHALRASAVQALGSVPGGRQELQALREEMDNLMAPVARGVLERLQQQNDAAAPPGQVEKIRKGLKSPNPRDRRQAAEQAKRFAYSEDVSDLLKEALANPEEKLSVKQAAIEALASFNNREAATLLQAVATDEKQSDDVRSEAIMGIARMESGVSANILTKLKAALKDQDLSDLAAGLADQQ